MKKQSVIFIFVFGVLSGLFLSKAFRRSPPVKTTEVLEAVDSNPLPPVVQAVKPPVRLEIESGVGKAVPKTEQGPAISAKQTIPPSQEVAEPSMEQQQVQQPRQVSLDISEQQVAAMESNLDRLQQEVSLHRIRGGWLVRFHGSQPNLLSSLGLQDNDRIRDEQFQSLKTDPEKENLVSRLEEVLNTLQR